MIIIIKTKNSLRFFGIGESIVSILDFRHTLSKRIWTRVTALIERKYPFRNREWICREMKEKLGFDPENPVY